LIVADNNQDPPKGGFFVFTMKKDSHLTTQDIEEAAKSLAGVVKNTPLQLSQRLSQLYDAQVFIKREDLQTVRSFKIRGAYNKISSLSPLEQKQGVVCASAGNHAQGVAFSCAALQIKGTIFMPAVTPNQKIEKVRQFGGKFVDIQLIGTTYDEASKAAKAFCEANKAIFVHPFNDPLTIAGQGTIGKEIYDKLEGNVDVVIVGIGGGGLISGVGKYIKTKKPEAKIIGAEPLGAAGMHQSFKKNQVVTLESIDTFVDGAAVQTVGDLTYHIASVVVDEILVAEEGKICATMIDLYQQDGIIAEPAGALAISVLDEIKDEIKGKTVVCILSGGNNDILRYPEIMEKNLVYKGLKHYFLIEFAQKPGQLRQFLNKALGPRDDIVLFEYLKKNAKEKGPALIGIELARREDLQPLLDKMSQLQIRYTKVTSGDPLYSFLL
jgi:threonine dehydratase